MRSFLVVVATCALTTLAACGADDEPSEPEDGPTQKLAQAEGDDPASPCDLIPVETMESLAQSEADDTPAEPSPGLMEDAADLVSCRLGSEFAVGFTRIDADQSLEEFLKETESGEPIEGVGDEALLTEDGSDLSVVARAADTLVRLETADLSEDVVIEAAAAIAELAAEQGTPEPIEVPEACPEVTTEPLVAETGEVSFARGHVDEDSLVSCDYAGAERSLRVQVFSNLPQESVDSFENIEPFDVTESGVEVITTGTGTVDALFGESCAVNLRSEAMPWSLEEERPEDDTRAALAELVDWVAEEIGCRS